MSFTREFRKNPVQGLKMYSNFFLPMKNFLEGQIVKLNLEVDIDQLYPLDEAWAHFCNDSVSIINRRKTREKRKAAYDGHIKRPMSGFMWFINGSREQYTKEHPDASMIDITKELSKRWGTLSEKEKEVYQQKNLADKERFEKERSEAYVKVKEEGRDFADSKPKKPLNPYLYFLKDESIKETIKAEIQKMRAEGINKNQMQFMSQKWEKMSEKEKEKYVKLSVDDNARYQKELADYNEKFKDYTAEELPTEKS